MSPSTQAGNPHGSTVYTMRGARSRGGRPWGGNELSHSVAAGEAGGGRRALPRHGQLLQVGPQSCARSPWAPPCSPPLHQSLPRGREEERRTLPRSARAQKGHCSVVSLTEKVVSSFPALTWFSAQQLWGDPPPTLPGQCTRRWQGIKAGCWVGGGGDHQHNRAPTSQARSQTRAPTQAGLTKGRQHGVPRAAGAPAPPSA